MEHSVHVSWSIPNASCYCIPFSPAHLLLQDVSLRGNTIESIDWMADMTTIFFCTTMMLSWLFDPTTFSLRANTDGVVICKSVSQNAILSRFEGTTQTWKNTFDCTVKLSKLIMWRDHWIEKCWKAERILLLCLGILYTWCLISRDDDENRRKKCSMCMVKSQP